jgi:dipeptidyl-peptidase 4
MTKFTIITTFILLFIAQAHSQQRMLTVEDAVLKQRTTLAPERLMQLQWIPETHILTYVVKVGGKEKVIHYDADARKVDTVYSIEQFQAAFKTVDIDNPMPQRLPFITWVNKITFRYYFNNAFYQVNLSNNIASVVTKIHKDAEDMEWNEPSGRTAFTQNNNVFVYEKDSWKSIGDDKQPYTPEGAVNYKGTMITQDGGYGLLNGKSVHRNEFGITKGMFWSPKGNKLAFYKMNEQGVTDYELMNFETKPGTFERIKYPMAGAPSHTVRVFIKDFAKNRLFEVLTNPNSNQYLTNIAWAPDEKTLLIAVVNRDQNEMKLNEYDANSGAFIKTLFTETDSKYVEPEHPALFLKNDVSKFIWQSKRNGFNQLYLYSDNGKLIKQLTQAAVDVTEVIGFDGRGKNLFYMAATNNGLDRQCFSLEIATGKSKLMTLASATHQVLFSTDGAFWVDNYSSASIPRKVVAMDIFGAEQMILLDAGNPLNAYATCPIRLGNIKALDAKTVLNYRMFLPPNFDSTKKYPVVVYVYGGPHAQMVTNSWLGGADMWLYYMAQQGYITFTLDNRGSANRGKEFEQATFRNLGKIEREDQLEGISFLKKLRYADSTRLGVFGWSFGGFMTVNLLSNSNTFKAGVAGGPVIDWRLYEIMYTERYMDKPIENEEGYKNADLTNFVKNLKGRLLLIHGTDDNVVLWQHSLTYLKKCVDENVQVDYFVYPDHKHNVTGKDRVHLMQKVTDYFSIHLK